AVAVVAVVRRPDAGAVDAGVVLGAGVSVVAGCTAVRQPRLGAEGRVAHQAAAGRLGGAVREALAVDEAAACDQRLRASARAITQIVGAGEAVVAHVGRARAGPRDALVVPGTGVA